MASKKFYYTQGFKIDDTKSSIQFILSLSENKIVAGPRVVVYYKSGATTEDFRNLLPRGMYIENDKPIMSIYHRSLSPKKLKFNDHEIWIYDLNNRVVNYVVSESLDSTLFETENHTTWVINKDLVTNPEGLKSLLDSSKYVEWRSYPVNEFYSYRSANTSLSTDIGKDEVVEIKAKHNKPINFKTYTKWRVEYATVLLGFYDQLKSHLPDFDIYMDGQKIQSMDELNPNRIDITLEGLADLGRRPYVYNHDLYQSQANLNLRIKTPDQLKYMHIKKKYQNVELISNIARFEVDDKRGLKWTNHIWWEPHRDSTQMSNIKDEQGRFTYTLDLRCQLHFYEVEDELYDTIDTIRLCFANLPIESRIIYPTNEYRK